MAYIYTSTIQEQALFGDLKDLVTEKIMKGKLFQLESVIDWEAKADLISSVYSWKGRNNIGTRIMIALQILKGIRHGVSDRDLVRSLQTDIEVMWFCGIRNIHDESRNIDSSNMTHFRNRISTVSGLIEKLQAVHVEQVVKDKVPYKKRGQYDQDSTVIEEKVSYPNDVDLLSKVVERGVKLTNKGKEIMGKARDKFINTGKRTAKKLQLSYHFAKEKGEEKILAIKKGITKIGFKVIQQMKLLKQDLETVAINGHKRAKKIVQEWDILIETGSSILAQQSEMIIKKSKSVANRIISLHKPQLRPIIKGKKGKAIEVGAKAQIGVIGGKVAMVVQHDWDNVHDSQTVKTGIELFKSIRRKTPKEAGFDKGYRAKDTNDVYLEAQGIDNGIQGSEPWKLHNLRTRKRLYNRRAFTEPLMNDIKNHRGANKNLLKKENAKQGLIWAVMASNYVRLYI